MCIIYIYATRHLGYNIARIRERVGFYDAPNGGGNMGASKAQQRATNKYISKAYDRINLTVPKGEKETIQAHAEAHSESINGFINRDISETMERDKGAPGAAGEAGKPDKR